MVSVSGASSSAFAVNRRVPPSSSVISHRWSSLEPSVSSAVLIASAVGGAAFEYVTYPLASVPKSCAGVARTLPAVFVPMAAAVGLSIVWFTLSIVRTGVATLNSFLNPAAIYPAVSVRAVPRICARLDLTTPFVKSSWPVPEPVDSSTLAPMSRPVCVVAPSFFVFTSRDPLRSWASVEISAFPSAP